MQLTYPEPLPYHTTFTYTICSVLVYVRHSYQLTLNHGLLIHCYLNMNFCCKLKALSIVLCSKVYLQNNLYSLTVGWINMREISCRKWLFWILQCNLPEKIKLRHVYSWEPLYGLQLPCHYWTSTDWFFTVVPYRIGGRIAGWPDCQVVGWMDGQMVGWPDGRMSG